ncbi:ionotropic receptor 75a-like [Bicyclus anynana]|uniref:Ionotropic receptor 75a-like n=1 Tax=Bicyclus anynana TaxID=110368 RepID=A0ABM3LMR5_BICAN|nr:ionotropic receptor 75a-like [Bicyclus anynana]
MLFNIILPLIYTLPLIFGNWNNFAIDYFKGRRVAFVCLLTCENDASPSIGVVISPKCSEFENIMYYASENVLFDSKHKWLIIEDNDIFQKSFNANESEDFIENVYNETHFINMNEVSITILNNLNLSVDADITLSEKLDETCYKLYEVYNFGKTRNGTFVVESIGDWNIHRVFDPEMVLGRVADHRVSKITHTGAMVLHQLTGVHNFRYNYTVVDRWVGDYVKEHKVATNALYFREQDITPVLRMLPHHFKRYDVAAPAVSFIEARYYYRIPSQGVGKFENQFLRPLSPGTWWCVGGMCALCCVVLLLSAIVEHRPMNVYYWYYSVFSVLALICQQFFEEFEDLRRISEARKMTILVTGLACLLLYNYYTSSVVSWLLNGPPPSINSLWELLDSPLTPVFEDVGYTYSWLQLPDYYFNRKAEKAEDELKRRLNNMIKKGKTVDASIKVGIELVRRGGYAYHAETNAANERISRTFDQRELCDLDSLLSFEHVPLYSCVQKNSPYKEFFSWSLARLLERGVLNCVHERTWTRELKCGGSSPRALALGGAAPAFIVLAAGVILGVLIMLVERIWWNCTTKNKKPLPKTPKEEWNSV